jgi:hypothetical protein
MDYSPGTRSAGFWISAHCRTRCRQRGTSHRTLTVILAWADVEVPVGSGATAFSVSADAAREMLGDGIAPQLIDRVRNRAVVAAEAAILTLIVGRSSRSRYYRRRMRSRDGRNGMRKGSN